MECVRVGGVGGGLLEALLTAGAVATAAVLAVAAAAGGAALTTAAALPAALCVLAAGWANFPGAGMPEPADLVLAGVPPELAALASSLTFGAVTPPSSRRERSCEEMLVCLKEIPLLDLIVNHPGQCGKVFESWESEITSFGL